jgi:hypothetical protein
MCRWKQPCKGRAGALSRASETPESLQAHRDGRLSRSSCDRIAGNNTHHHHNVDNSKGSFPKLISVSLALDMLYLS